MIATQKLNFNNYSTLNYITIIFSSSENPSISLYDDLFIVGLDYSKQEHRISVTQRLSKTVSRTIIQCILTSSSNDKVINYATSRPKRHFGKSEFPILYDLESKTSYYFKRNYTWGALFLPEIRLIADNMFAKI